MIGVTRSADLRVQGQLPSRDQRVLRNSSSSIPALECNPLRRPPFRYWAVLYLAMDITLRF